MTGNPRDAPDAACSRCQRLSLECRVDNGFRRVRKRTRSFEMESEIQSLRRQLRNKDQVPSPALDWNLGLADPGLLPESPAPNYGFPMMATPAEAGVGGRQMPARPASSAGGSGPSPNPTEHSRAPGLTTRPAVDEPPSPRRRAVAVVPRPRALGNIALSVEEIEELFSM